MKRPPLATAPTATGFAGLKTPAALCRDRGGAAALEYALLASLIAAPLAFAAPGLGAAVQDLLGGTAQPLRQALRQAAISCEAPRAGSQLTARLPGPRAAL